MVVETKVSKRTEELLAQDKAHVIHGFFTFGQNLGIVMERADKVYMWDTEGKRYIDFSSEAACMHLGHGRKDLIDAMAEQGNKSDLCITLYGLSNVPVIENGRRLAEITPEGINHFFHSTSGSEAVDSAIRTARMYWRLQGKSSKYKIISLYNSFHGSTPSCSGHLTARGLGVFWLEQQAPGFPHIPEPYCYHCPFKKEYPGCDIFCAKFLEDTIIQQGVDSVAAFIAEAVLGGAGFITPPPEYWPRVREICTKHNVLLIDDEVITGFCRTGKWFAIEHWGVKPDIITMAKGITGSYFPYAATGFSDEVFDVLESGGLAAKAVSEEAAEKQKAYAKGGTWFFHGYTFSGHSIGAAVSNKAIEIYEKEKVAENAAKIGRHMNERFEKEFMPLPNVGTAGGFGCMQAIELVKDKKTRELLPVSTMVELQKKFLDAGMWLRIYGTPSIRLAIAPPCTITIEEVDEALDITKSVIVDYFKSR